MVKEAKRGGPHQSEILSEVAFFIYEMLLNTNYKGYVDERPALPKLSA